MVTMIEKMARAIMVSRGGCSVTDWREAEWNPNVAQALSDARAALEALLEPSEAMVEAGDSEVHDRYCQLAKRAYQAMIRAALEEK